jgi:hypothetical protein
MAARRTHHAVVPERQPRGIVNAMRPIEAQTANGRAELASAGQAGNRPHSSDCARPVANREGRRLIALACPGTIPIFQISLVSPELSSSWVVDWIISLRLVADANY